MSEVFSIVAWNINGYDDTIHALVSNLLLGDTTPDVLFLSETKKTEKILSDYLSQFENYNVIYNVHNPPRYHGVVMLINKRLNYEFVPTKFNIPCRSDNKSGDPTNGRVITILLEGKYYVVGTYVPNSGNTDKDRVIKLDYRINCWDKALQQFLEELNEDKPVIWCGDINVAPEEIDVSNPKTMVRYAGFRPEERESFRSFLATGWIDVWRYKYPNEKVYTWIGSSPKPNYGLRLDNIVVSSSLADNIALPFIINLKVPVSDHLAVGSYFYF